MTGERRLREELAKQLQNPKAILVGEAAGRFGRSVGMAGRLMPLPLSESGTVGLAVGLALAGQRPIVELLDADGLARAAEALSEAGSISGRTEGSFSAPIVVLAPAPARLPTLPEGIRVYAAADPADAAGMLATAMSSQEPAILLLSQAALQGTVEDTATASGARIVRPGSGCTVLAWGDGVQAALATEGAEVVDLRVLAPLDRGTLGESVRRTGRVVVVGADALLPAAVQEAFLYLESPPLSVGANAEAIATAVRQSIDY